MEFNDVLNRRYSCKAFATQEVEKETLEAIINVRYPAAYSMPSPMHGERKSLDELVTRRCI